MKTKAQERERLAYILDTLMRPTAGERLSRRLIDDVNEATRLLAVWGDALYECRADSCKCRQGFHLRNFDAAQPTRAFLKSEPEAGEPSDA